MGVSKKDSFKQPCCALCMWDEHPTIGCEAQQVRWGLEITLYLGNPNIPAGEIDGLLSECWYFEFKESHDQRVQKLHSSPVRQEPIGSAVLPGAAADLGDGAKTEETTG